MPIYATKLTNGLIEHKLEEHGLLDKVKRKVVKYGQHINLGCFRVEFVKTNHSIQDAAALAIYTPAGVIMHTGDFKVDYTPVYGDAIDLQRFGEIGKKGVLALMCDSTNAERPGFTMTERKVGKTFDSIFSDHTKQRIIVATFASNVDRVQQIINTAYKFGRKVVVEGRSMVNIISIASSLGYLNVPENTLIDIEQLKNYPDEKTVLITTGSQGEPLAALSRMANGVHRKVKIHPNDLIIFSSNPIPGNEKAVSKIINELYRQSADVIFQECDYITIHVPLTDSTKGMINKEKLDMMKDGVVVLNFARDTLVNDDDMAAALESGKVHRYVSDFPNPKVAHMHNVILLPHLGASTKESEDNCAVMAVEELTDYIENGNIKNSVNYPACDMGECHAACRVAVLHKNIPNMIGQITGILAGQGVNISDMTNKSRDKYAYTLLDLEHRPEDATVKKLTGIDGVLRVRVVK